MWAFSEALADFLGRAWGLFFSGLLLFCRSIQKWGKTYWVQTEFVPQHFTMNSPEINLNCLTVCSSDERAGTCLKWWVALWVQVQHCQCRALAGVTQPCGSSCASVAARGFLTLLLALAKIPELSSSFTPCRLWLLFSGKVFAVVLTCSWVTLTQQQL